MEIIVVILDLLICGLILISMVLLKDFKYFD